MKLVDILARDMKEWPEGLERIQGCMWAYVSLGRYAETPWFNESATHEEWQAAVDALKAERVAEWGNGIPPVGSTCERRFPNVESSSWQGGIVLAHGSKKIFFRDNCGDEWAHSIDDVEFRPFRTPEQIAAEERDLAIDEMLKIAEGPHGGSSRKVHVSRPQVAALYDAGYRKFEIVES